MSPIKHFALIAALAPALASCDSPTTPWTLAGTYVARVGDRQPFPMRLNECAAPTETALWVTGADVEIFAGDSLYGHVYVSEVAANGTVGAPGYLPLYDYFTVSGDTLYRTYSSSAPVVGVIHGSTMDLNVYWAYPPSSGCPPSVHSLTFMRGLASWPPP